MFQSVGFVPAAICAAFALLLCTTPAGAQEHDYSRAGLYVGGGFSYATDLYEEEIEDALASGVSVDIEDSFGVNARMGARFFRFIALEIQYEWLDDYDIKIPSAGGLSNIGVHTLTGNLKVYLPIQRFQPYVLAGVGFQRYEIDSNYLSGAIISQDDDYVLAGRVGLGFDAYLTEHVVFYAEGSVVLSNASINLPQPAGTVDNLFYAGFQSGLIWRF